APRRTRRGKNDWFGGEQIRGGKRPQSVVVVVDGQAQLLEVVLTADAVGRFAYLLHRREQQPDQEANDSDDHQQLDQRESTGRTTVSAVHALSPIGAGAGNENRESGSGIPQERMITANIACH